MGDYSDTIYKFVNSIMNVNDDLENFQESLVLCQDLVQIKMRSSAC